MVELEIENEEADVALPVEILVETNVKTEGDVRILFKTLTEKYVNGKKTVTINSSEVYFSREDIDARAVKSEEIKGDGTATLFYEYEHVPLPPFY